MSTWQYNPTESHNMPFGFLYKDNLPKVDKPDRKEYENNDTGFEYYQEDFEKYEKYIDSLRIIKVSEELNKDFGIDVTPEYYVNRCFEEGIDFITKEGIGIPHMAIGRGIEFTKGELVAYPITTKEPTIVKKIVDADFIEWLFDNGYLMSPILKYHFYHKDNKVRPLTTECLKNKFLQDKK